VLKHLSDNQTVRIHSHPEHANGPHKPSTPAQFDTILMCVDEQGHETGGFQGNSGYHPTSVFIHTCSSICTCSSHFVYLTRTSTCSTLATQHATMFQMQWLCQLPIMSSPVTWLLGFQVVPSTLTGVMETV